MKFIPLRETAATDQLPAFKTVDIIRVVMEQPPQGVNVGEMRKRVRVLDALDALPAVAEVLAIEDADHAVLAQAAAGFVFARATRDLLALIDGIIGAGSAEGAGAG